MGGANSIRAFAVRDIGPGSFSDYGLKGKQARQNFYLMRNGDMKLVTNFEYRTPLFGNLKGAVFFDAGNVWRLGHLNFELSEDDIAQLNAPQLLKKEKKHLQLYY